jgi:hypothetical protein
MNRSFGFLAFVLVFIIATPVNFGHGLTVGKNPLFVTMINSSTNKPITIDHRLQAPIFVAIKKLLVLK